MNEVRGKKEEGKMVQYALAALRIALRVAMAAAASVTLLFVLKPALPKNEAVGFESVEPAFNNLSQDDQDYLLSVYEHDVFIDNIDEEQ